jgi:hypothetical protein
MGPKAGWRFTKPPADTGGQGWLSLPRRIATRFSPLPAWVKNLATTDRENDCKTSRQKTLLSVERRKFMKHLWLVILLLAAGCSDKSDNTKQSTNDVESANESSNKQIETLLASKYSAVSNWETNLLRHGTTSAVFSIDIQKALTSASPILFTAHLHDIAVGTNGMPYAEFTQRYNRDKSATGPDFELILIIQLTDEQAQKILNTSQDVLLDEYAIVAKISTMESSAQYADVNDDWPTLYVDGKCVDFSLLK